MLTTTTATDFRRIVNRHTLTAVAAICLLTALAGVRPAAGQGTATRGAAPIEAGKPSGKPFHARFSDVATEAGLDMRFVFGDDAEKSYLIEANGGGVAFVDLDGDGWLDLFFVNGSTFKGGASAATSRLYLNTRDGKFANVSVASGVARSGWGSGVCAGDYDGDGDTDLYVTYWGLNSLYRNNGTGKFSDLAKSSGSAGRPNEWTSGCTFADIDRDGDLDLLTTRYQEFDPKTAPAPGFEPGSDCAWKTMPVFCGPRGLPFGGLTLYRNDGDGRFTDISEQSGIRDVDSIYAFTPVAADFDGDGWVDFYIACDSTASVFFMNNGDGTFVDVGIESGLAYSEHGFEQGGMGVAVGDFNRDGQLDIVKTNFAGDYPNMYRNLGDGLFEDVVVRVGLASNPQYVGWGVGLIDFDNDGHEDVLQINGHVYPKLDKWPQVGEQYRQPPVLYRNLGTGRFEDVSSLAGPAFEQKLSSRGAAFGDYDNDGDVDVVVVNMGKQVSLLRNDLTGSGHWVRIKLQGVTSNKSGIGARISVDAEGVERTRAVLSQDSFLSHSDLRSHFGLGSAQEIDSVTVYWPNGNVEKFLDVGLDREVLLIEGSGRAAEATRP